MTDTSKGFTRYDNKAALGAFDITPSDTANLERTAKSLYIGSAGDVKVTTIAGDTVTFKAVPVGILPVVVTKVFETGTTEATRAALIGLY